MTTRAAHRFAAFLVLALAVPARAGDQHPPGVTAGVEILVDGVPRPRYGHEGRWYVEALKGREYAIRLRNPYPVRVAVALSVDGLNTIDARETTAARGRKWVLGPYETITIQGWQTSRTDARRFAFTTEARSYGQALGRTANLGVIAAVFFKEREAPALEDGLRADERADASGASGPRSDAPAPSGSAPAAPRAEGRAADAFAATGMGRRIGHAVRHVWLDLEDAPAASVTVRYEFRPQLVRLGVLPAPRRADPLERRERARGFEPDYCPDLGRPAR